MAKHVIELRPDQKVYSCGNQLCRLYGVPDNTPHRRRGPNSKCRDCSGPLDYHNSLACLKCETCNTWRNYFHLGALQKNSDYDQVACVFCGSNNTQLKLFANLPKPSNAPMTTLDHQNVEKTEKAVALEDPKQSITYEQKLPLIPKRAAKSKKPKKAVQADARERKAAYRNKRPSSSKKPEGSKVSLSPPLPKLKSALSGKSEVSSKDEKKEQISSKSNSRVRKLSASEKRTAEMYERLEKGTTNKSDQIRSNEDTTKKNYAWRDNPVGARRAMPIDEFAPPKRRCAECGAIISMSTLQARPDTKFCLNHIEKAGRLSPNNEGIMSRKGAKAMRGSDRNLAQRTKRVL